MMLWDALLWLAIAKVAVLLFEDASWAARGKRSPRMKDRTRRAEGAGERPARGWGRAGQAVGEYVARLVEDGAGAARAGRRRRQARKRGRQAIDGVLVNLDDDACWYADCDVCDWSSRAFQLEHNARAAATEHARIHTDRGEGDHQAPTNSSDDETRPRHRLTVIPGGAADPALSGPTSTVVHDDHTYCLVPGCPACRPAGFGWSCSTCGAREEPFDSEADARAAGARHICPGPVSTDPAGDVPTDSDPAGDTASANTNTKEKAVNLEATGPEEIRAAFSAAIEIAQERAEELDGEAAVLVEAADRYESLKMAPSTVAHLRDAADQFSTAGAALLSAAEELEAALADFEAKDGHVAEAVDTAGGNVASEEVLVG